MQWQARRCVANRPAAAALREFTDISTPQAYRYVLPDGCQFSDADKYGLYLVTAAVDRSKSRLVQGRPFRSRDR